MYCPITSNKNVFFIDKHCTSPTRLVIMYNRLKYIVTEPNAIVRHNIIILGYSLTNNNLTN